MENRIELNVAINVLDTLNVGISLVAKSGRAFYANSMMLKFLKCNFSEYVNYYSDVAASVKKGTLTPSFSQIVFQTKAPYRGCQLICDRYGEARLFHGHFYPVFDTEGEVLYTVGISRPVDEIRKEFYESIGFSREYSHLYLTNGEEHNIRIIYRSVKMRRILHELGNVAETDATILLQGESGTGKDVLARMVHETSGRRDKALVRLNCASVPESLFESELFGYEKGSFTGALTQGKKGIIEESHDGTLFLDEINSMPIGLQGKLLQTLEDRTVKKIGSSKAKYVNFRLIAATNADLKQCIKEGTFRADLYFRLNVVFIVVPPLRERKDDIELLTQYYLQVFCEKYGREKFFSGVAKKQLYDYDWPGNVRELRNFVERIVLVSDSSVKEIKNISPELLSSGRTIGSSDSSTKQLNKNLLIGNHTLMEIMGYYEKQILNEALTHYGSPGHTARALGIDPSTMSRKIAKYKLKG